MHARFLLGPAGSGKTYSCLSEIRELLLKSSSGPPLLFLAPKQATFQLERELLSRGALSGYTRLEILSFERLALRVLERVGRTCPDLLNDEGRLMVLRALLLRHGPELEVYRSSSSMPGFARQLSAVLQELRQSGIARTDLSRLSKGTRLSPELRGKLHDLALMLERYAEWLGTRQLRDERALFDEAVSVLNELPRTRLPEEPALFQSLWLDGFAEMTKQELDLLAALIPHTGSATLAFCAEPGFDQPQPWHSPWNLIHQTVNRCHGRISALPGVITTIAHLPRRHESGRFAHSPELAHLEAHWANPIPFPARPEEAALCPIRALRCANAEAEARCAAREILKHVRGGGRYREVAVLVRSLEGYHDVLRRMFRRYGIPYFLDRREPVAHHPLAELSRHAVRLAAFAWQSDDWFAVLRAGFTPASSAEIDALENEALRFGWTGNDWLKPLLEGNGAVHALEPLRQRLVPPFAKLVNALRAGPTVTGQVLASSLRALWADLGVLDTLEKWASHDTDLDEAPRAVHRTVGSEMAGWLDTLALGLGDQPLALELWLPILETGLAGLSVGVVPPAMDQVLIGAIDRSRNPDLQHVFLLGLNEGVFPAMPAQPPLLTENERSALAGENVILSPTRWERSGHELFYGYIACTRARRGVVLTCASFDRAHRALNPSPLLARLARLFPGFAIEPWPGEADGQVEHPSEWVPAVLRHLAGATPEARLQVLERIKAIPGMAERGEQLNRLAAYAPEDQLSPRGVELLYGSALRTSVTALERFAACPFQFFVRSGLRGKERDIFEPDSKRLGEFQHLILRAFHEEAHGRRGSWRSVNPAEARQLIAAIGGDLMQTFHHGLLSATARNRFLARQIIRRLQDLAALLVEWMSQYDFEPVAVELSFGRGGHFPPWQFALSGGRELVLSGTIDRIDLYAEPDSAEGWCVVIDYKSSAKKLDSLFLENGLQIQLPAYLCALRQAAVPGGLFGVDRLMPAGAFYVALRGKSALSPHRGALEQGADDARKLPFRHSGRFNEALLDHFDNRGAQKGDQFSYQRTKNGLHRRNADPMPSAEFNALLDRVEGLLREYGEQIFQGNCRIDPYQKGAARACTYCECKAICRIDPWTHPFRALRAGERELPPSAD